MKIIYRNHRIGNPQHFEPRAANFETEAENRSRLNTPEMVEHLVKNTFI